MTPSSTKPTLWGGPLLSDWSSPPFHPSQNQIYSQSQAQAACDAFSFFEFVGSGALKEVIESLVADGWDDVPTLKMMNPQDMEAHHFTQRQRDALEIRSYLHDRSLMEYADKLEACGKPLAELLGTNPTHLSAQLGMKRGHVARFIDRSTACGIAMPPTLVLPARKTPSSSTDGSSRSPGGASTASSQADPGRKPLVFKGIVAAAPPEPRFCGLVKPPAVAESVAPLAVVESISVQKLTPEYKVGMGALPPRELKAPPPMKASDIWATKPAVILCIRRPGCVMCRAEAHQLYARKPIFDAMGFQLIAVLHEFIDAEVKEFWPHYWGGMVVVDKNKDFFRALGGGQLPKESFITGFIFNPRAIANYKRAKATGIKSNYNGDGFVKGGLFIMGSGKSGVAYQFVERNFGDWAPLAEVLEVCSKLQKDTPP